MVYLQQRGVSIVLIANVATTIDKLNRLGFHYKFARTGFARIELINENIKVRKGVSLVGFHIEKQVLSLYIAKVEVAVDKLFEV